MINLLPPLEKKEISGMEILKLTLVLGLLAILFLLDISLILFSIKIYISGQADSQRLLVDLEKKELSRNQELQGTLNSVNQEVSKLASFYNKQFNTIEFLERLSKLTPDGVYLSSFSYQKSDSHVSLLGYASTVADLVGFKDNLGQQKDFKDIRFPNSVWVETSNINFDATFKITP